ncbi:sialidase [Archangium violaceum]|uniref:RCC1 domain-containing protein n=1 Tax=Archangium violaceum TaxID=83451 RepID=UPI00194F6347|nr:MopE-related protein [Archangium violaceum]QRN97743.1 sialidase [Archangium violaceum]
MLESEFPARTGEALPAEAKDERTVAAALVTRSTVTKAISAGNFHSLALRTDGSVWAWGQNTEGQLGNGTQTLSKVPVRVTGLPAIKAIAAGRNHSLALGVDGTVWAWGQNSSGQLGDGTTTGRLTPVSVTIPGGAVAIAGGLSHSLAIAADGGVYAWGANTYGQLGDGTTSARLTPVRLGLPGGIAAISAGWYHSMALGADGRVWTWGRNVNGQIGNTIASSVNQLSPYQVSLARGATAIAAGANHALVLLSDQSMVAWGQNTNGQLGNGTTATAQSTPVVVGLTGAVTAIATGSNFSLAIDSTGAAWGWGQNTNGQLGDGTTVQRTSPVRVQGLNDALALSSGLFHALALRPGCPFWAWGVNSSGQLGDGTQSNQLTLTQVQLQNIYFYDADTDGYGGDLLSPVEDCQPPGPEYVENDLDCDDFDLAVNPEATEVCDGLDNNCNGQTDEEGGSTWYRDADDDKYGNAAVISQACVQPSGYVTNSSDCDDSKASVKPGATEACNGVDDNCNGSIDEAGGSTWYRDADGDGYGTATVSTQACAQPSGYVSNSSDCNDTQASVKPGATEVCNGVDDNCNGSIDEAGGSTWYRDADGDGYGTATVSTQACVQPSGYVSNSSDCNDTQANVKPGATEVCNGVDDNCNGSIDEGVPTTTWYRDADGDGRGTPSVSTQACSAPAGYVSTSDDCNDADASLPRYFVRDSDEDGYGYGFVVSPAPAAPWGCIPPAGYSTRSDDCDDSRSSVHPGAAEVCDRQDNNCNGSLDEGCSCSAWLTSNRIPSGGTATFGFTSSGPFPAGSRAYLYGTRNGVVDTNGSLSYDQISFSYLVLNSPGLEGYYERYVVIRGPDNLDLCTTNTVSAWFLYP